MLGDLAAIGAEPGPTLERLTNLPNVRFVRGNTDRYNVTGERPWPHADDVACDESLRELFDAVESSFAWTRAELEPGGWLGWLAELPGEQRRYQVRMRSMLASVLVPDPDRTRRLELADEAMAIAALDDDDD